MDLTVAGPTLTLRVPVEADAPALFRLASDPEVTRWFSWGPYEHEDDARSYLAGLADQRARGDHLDLIVVHREHGPIGVTGLSEIARRDRRAMVGTWFGRRWWGTGANAESKALVAHLAFRGMGLERLGAYTNVLHVRSQSALRGLGFRREGVLRHWHRHGDELHDVVMWSILRGEWERSKLHAMPVELSGEVPPAFVLG